MARTGHRRHSSHSKGHGHSGTHGHSGSSNARKSKSIGHYLLGKTLGEGTFGKVRIGTHIMTGEKVAIKILEKSRIVEAADVERVSREISILKRVRHKNVIQLFEVIDTPRQIFLIMEYRCVCCGMGMRHGMSWASVVARCSLAWWAYARLLQLCTRSLTSVDCGMPRRTVMAASCSTTSSHTPVSRNRTRAASFTRSWTAWTTCTAVT